MLPNQKDMLINQTVTRCSSLKRLGFTKSSQDPAVYKRSSKDKILIVGVYVDDLIITGSNTNNVVEFKEQMKKEFKMSDWGLLSY